MNRPMADMSQSRPRAGLNFQRAIIMPARGEAITAWMPITPESILPMKGEMITIHGANYLVKLISYDLILRDIVIHVDVA